MDNTPWVQLIEGNDWGAIYYKLDIKTLNDFGTVVLKERINLHEGQVLRVQFPSGHEGTYPLAARNSFTSISDHGLPYQVLQTRYGVTVDVHGINTWISVEDLLIEPSSLESSAR